MTVAGRAIVGALQFSPSVLNGDGQCLGLVLAGGASTGSGLSSARKALN